MLVGRRAERQVLDELLSGARLGAGGVLVLSGEPGIGKTTLLDESVRLAAGMQLLRAQGVESEQLLPFAGLSQLLHPLLPDLGDIPAAQATALRSALLLGEGEAPTPTRFAVGAATLSLLSRAAERCPVAVLFDDAHLVDEPSAAALAFAARRLAVDPVAVLVAARAGEPGTEAWRDLPVLEVTGLDLAAATELVGSATAVRLHGATGGNPLGLLELRDAPITAGPEDAPLPVSDQVTRAFLQQVSGLDPDARATLLVAAADGSSAVRVLEAARSLGVRGPGLTKSEQVGLVSVHQDRVAFRHPLVRSAVYAAAEPGRRREVHRALAATLPDHETDRLAWHLAEAAIPPDDDTAQALVGMAADATRRGGHAVAATVLERAGELAGSAQRQAARMVEAGFSYWLAGDPDRVLALAQRALRHRTDAVLRARAQELRGAALVRFGSAAEGWEVLVTAAEEVADVDPGLAVRLHADAVDAALQLADPAAAMRSRVALEKLGHVAGDAASQALIATASGMALVLAGQGKAGMELLRTALPILADEAAVDVLHVPVRSHAALWVRDRSSARAELLEVAERLRRRAALGSLPNILTYRARDLATSREWDDAVVAYTEAVALARETGQTTDLAIALAGLAMLDARRGEANRCETGAAEAAALAGGRRLRLALMWAGFALGDLAAGRGDPGTAVRHYRAVEKTMEETGLADPDQSCAPELVECLLHLARPEQAGPVAERFEAQALAKGEPWSLARAARTRGLLATGPGAAQAAFAEALELHAYTPDLYEVARTRLALGAWLRRDRRRIEARGPLREALAAFDELGAVPWADRAAQELQATGEHAHRRDLGPVEQLTPQEHQIARLLASGLTTREAAASVFLSPKTVEYHLRHVYQKLGIRSRAELTEVMAPDR